MDFFQAQDRARQRTSKLVVLFALAVLGTILASYLAAITLVGFTNDRTDYSGAYYTDPQPWLRWDAGIFTAVTVITLLVVGFASLFKWAQMRHGGSAVAEMVGGRRVAPNTTDPRERRLLNVVEEMAIASGVPVPAVYLLENEPGINAFAAGLTTSDAVVAVTRGTMEKLSRDELQGVVAHEFSHILNGDMRLNVKLTAIVFGILVIGLIGRGMLYAMGRGRVRGGRNSGGGIAMLLAIGLAMMIIGYFGYFFGRLIQAAVSRQREFLADASAVQFTRNPAGIGGALKKIGGYALGSRMLDNRAAEIGHFFFAQGFRSNFGGLWATHPPLPERIRAIEPNWKGEMFDPPAVVDVQRESFAGAGLAGAQHPELRKPRGVAFQPAAIVATIGALAETHFRQAQSLLEAIPPALREAAHDPAAAASLVYALLIGPASSDIARRQLDAIRQHAGELAANATSHLRPAVEQLPAGSRLPLLQLCVPTLRTLDRAALDRFVTTLDELVHADAHVSPFEFALQKMLAHQLELLKKPAQQRVEFHAFAAVADDITLVLSSLARTGATEEAAAQRAFAQGAAQLPLIAAKLVLEPGPEIDLARLDTALDRLALSSFPIKQRTLIAAAHVIGADRTVTVEEGELYRAIAAAIDCPVPTLGSGD